MLGGLASVEVAVGGEGVEPGSDIIGDGESYPGFGRSFRLRWSVSLQALKSVCRGGR